MRKYFDHTFFKFLFGFLAILGISFVILIAIGYYQTEINNQSVKATVDLGDH